MEMYVAVFVTLVLGWLVGIWMGLKAFAAQRQHIDHALQHMDENVVELSKLMHDGRLTPDAVRGWIAAIRMDFSPRGRKQ